jgi:uncharacterized protein involved in outer membrane biogenesis
MKWLLRALFAVIALVVIAVAGAAIFLWTFDPNAYKDDLIAAVEARTGRSFALKGDVALTVYPWVGLTADGIEIGNAANFGPEPFLKAGRIAVRAKLLPLLSRELQMDVVKLEGAELNLARKADGSDNWRDLSQPALTTPAQPPTAATPEPAPAAEPAPTASPGEFPLAALVIGGVDISGLKLVWDDARAGQKFTLSDFSATTGALKLGEPVPFTAKGQIESTAPALAGGFTLESTLNYDLGAERFVLAPIKLTGDFTGKSLPGGKASVLAETSVTLDLGQERIELTGINIQGLEQSVKGEIKSTLPKSGSPALDVTLDAAGPDLAVLFRAFGVEPLASDLAKLPKRDFRAEVKAQIDPDARVFSVPALDVSALGATLKGEVSQAGADINGRLDASGPNLPALLRTLGAAGLIGPGPIKDAGRALSDYGAAPEFAATLAFTANPGADTLQLKGVKASLLGGTLATEALQVAGLKSGKTSLKGSLSAEGPDVVAWLALIAALDEVKDDPLAKAIPALRQGKDRSYALKATVDIDAASGKVDLKGLNARALGAVASGDISTSAGSYAGSLKLASDAPGPLLTAFGQAELGAALKRFEVSLPIKGSASLLAIEPLALNAIVTGPQGPVELRLGAGVAANPAAGDYSLRDFAITGLGMNITGNVTAMGLTGPGAGSLDANLEVPPFNLRQVLTTLKQPLPVMADGTALTQVGLKAAIKAAGERAEVKGFDLALDGSRITGDFTVNSLHGPDVAFRLKGDKLDTSRYLPPQDKTVATPETAAGAATELPLPLLRTLKVDGQIDFDQLVLSGMKLKGVSVTIKGADGRINAEPVKASLYEGSYQGAVGIDATGPAARINIDSTLSGIQAEPLLTDLQGKSRLRGRGDLSMKLTASGANSQLLTQSVNGDIGFRFNDGAIRGVNIGKLMRQLENGVFANVDSESTDFTELSANLKCTDGVCSNDDLSMKSPLVRLGGKGVMVDLRNNTIDYVIQATLVGTAAGQGGEDLGVLKGVTIPIKVSGPTASPKYGIDFGGLLKKKAEDEVKKLIGKQLGVDLLGGKAAEPAADPAAPAPAPATDPAVPAPAPATDPAAPAPAPAEAPKSPKDQAKEAVEQGLKKLLKF